MAYVSLPATPDEEYSIEVEDVSMIFNMASEVLNNLKEYFIKAMKHELFFKEFRALNHISFKVKKGEVVGLVGTNGSGKSTMLKCIAGVLEPSEGTIIVRGNIAPLIELGAGFDPELTALENIYLNGYIAKLGRQNDCPCRTHEFLTRGVHLAEMAFAIHHPELSSAEAA